MILTSLLAAAIAAATPPPSSVSAEARYQACVSEISIDKEKAIAGADSWRAEGGGIPARQCLGMAYVAAERWGPAALAFEQGARDAELHHDGRAATLWVQSGNASLAGDDAIKARTAFDRALALDTMSNLMSGETLIDRARANVAAKDLPLARADLDAALKLVPQDPMAWLLSATLARIEGKLERAAADIAQAAKLAPGDKDVAAEQDRIAEVRSGGDAAIKAP